MQKSYAVAMQAGLLQSSSYLKVTVEMPHYELQNPTQGHLEVHLAHARCQSHFL